MGMETKHSQPGEAEALTSDRCKPLPAAVGRRMIMKAYMTIEEVARSLRVSVPTVRWLRQEGRFAPAPRASPVHRPEGHELLRDLERAIGSLRASSAGAQWKPGPSARFGDPNVFCVQPFQDGSSCTAGSCGS
jgi:Helix-turn-helix domain